MNRLTILIRRIAYLSFGYINNLFLPKSPKIFVLCYHAISGDNWFFSVSFEEFKKQINYLLKEFSFITLLDLYEYLKSKKVVHKSSVILCFDDGYQSIYRTRDLLKKFNIKPTIFLISDIKNIDREQLGSNKSFLSKRQILDLLADGWEIGCHSATHTNLLKLNPKNLDKEVIESKLTLEKKLGVKVEYFAYPNGNHNKQIRDAVSRAKYKLALSMDDGFISKSTDKLAVPRIGINGSHSFAEFKTIFSPLNIMFRKFIKSF